MSNPLPYHLATRSEQVRMALQYSRHYLACNPYDTVGANPHIKGLCDLLQDIHADALARIKQLEAEKSCLSSKLEVFMSRDDQQMELDRMHDRKDYLP